MTCGPLKIHPSDIYRVIENHGKGLTWHVIPAEGDEPNVTGKGPNAATAPLVVVNVVTKTLPAPQQTGEVSVRLICFAQFS